MSNVTNFVKDTSKLIQKQHKEYILFNHISIYIKDELPEIIDLDYCIKKIENIIPMNITQEVDEIFIGSFVEFIQRNVNAVYKDGAIYVTNDQSSNEDFIEDVVHEIAHAVEEKYGVDIYYDREIEREFLGKRIRLFSMVEDILVGNKKEIFKSFTKVDYDKKFDMFLYKTLGYNKLDLMIPGLFMSSYSITSIREYFANGFENYFLHGKLNLLKKVCPALYFKLDNLGD